MKLRHPLRRLAILAGAALLIWAAVYALGEAYKTRDYLDDFIAAKSELVSVTETMIEETGDYSVVHVVLSDERGTEIEGHLKEPSTSSDRHGALIILGGVGTGRRTVDYLGNTGDWRVLALDYPYRGATRGVSRRQILAALPEIRRAMLDTVPAGMLAVDYLRRRDDVDPERIVLAGGSFGALFAPALAAADERISAVAVFFGAGDLDTLIKVNLKMRWPLKPVVGWAGSVMVSPMEPLKYIDRVSPRPVFLLNGTGDPTMPERPSRLLHEAAREPKTLRWLEVDHVMLQSPEFRDKVLGEFLTWLQQIGFITERERLDLQ